MDGKLSRTDSSDSESTWHFRSMPELNTALIGSILTPLTAVQYAALLNPE